jgi:hypothetical protein
MLWPVPVLLCAAALAFAGFRVLDSRDGQTVALRRALTVLSRPKPAAQLLEQASRSGPTPVRAQASNVLAALTLRQGGRDATAQSEHLYANAVRLDPADDASKFDLELLLTIGGGNRTRQHSKARSKAGKHAPAHEQPNPGGAGATSGGKGY